MTPFLQFALILAILLLIAKFAGYLSVLVGQPSVLGELLAGLILGPSVINILGIPIFTDTHLADSLSHLAEIGVLLLMFVAGLELNLREMVHSSRVSVFAGLLGVVVPVLLGIGVGLLFKLGMDQSVFLGLSLGATSVSISAQTLMELKVLRTRVGLGLLGAAVFDDVLVILLLSVFLALATGQGGTLEILLIFVRMLAFFGFSALLGIWLLPRLVRLVAPLPISQSVLSLALIVLLVYGVAAEVLGGMAAITGTFLAGLMFARSPEKERIERGIQAVAYGFFVPIFFIHIGMAINLRNVDGSALLLLVVMTIAAVVGKFGGASFGARLAGFSKLESSQLGAGMISRGEVGLILGSVGLAEGLMNPSEFSALVGMVILTTLITPLFLRFLFSKNSEAHRANSVEKISQEKP